MELHTERLVLREFVKTDWEAVHRYASLGSVARFMAFEPYTEEDARRFVKHAIGASRQRPRLSFGFAIVLRGTSDLVGTIQLARKQDGAPEAEISFALHPSHWGQGFVPEAAREMLALGFRELRLHRIFAECHPDNHASVSVMRKIGMTCEGCFRQKRWIKGRWWDISHHAILDFEFDPSQGFLGDR